MSLGRGLGALITPTASRNKKVFSTGNAANFDAVKIWQIPISEILVGNNPRKNFTEENLSELAVSIKNYGILEPLLVVEKNNGGYELVAGERRWRAAQMAGLTTVPAIVKELAEQEKLEIALIENLQRADLNPIEEAFAFQRLVTEFGLTQQAISDKVAKSRPAVANSLRLLELPEEIQSALINKKINTGQARALLSLETRAQQLAALSSMLGERITVRELERKVAGERDPDKGRRDPNLRYLEDKMRTALGTKVAITQKADKGTIVISYYSQEELKRLVDSLCRE